MLGRTERAGRGLVALIIATLSLLGLLTLGSCASSAPTDPIAIPTLPAVVTTTNGTPEPSSVATASPSTSATVIASEERSPSVRHPDIGFASRSRLESHWRKHGNEFGKPSLQEYLRMAQELRDAPLSDQVIEERQRRGNLARFDRRNGAFLAYDEDLTIRTYFRPDDGEDYFWRAIKATQ
jgi:hypothetical protein